MLPCVPAHARKVLVVDDDAKLRREVASRISDLGVEVVEARDGGEGLARLSDGTPLPGAILLDVVAPPPPGGSSFLQALRGEPRLCRIPVLSVSRGQEASAPPPAAARDPAPFDVEEVAQILVSLCDG